MKNLTIRVRLIFAMGSLSILLAAIGATALYGLKKNNETFRAVYDNRLVAVAQLDTVIRSILRTQIELSLAAHDPATRISVHLHHIEDNMMQADSAWAAYIASGITAAEKPLLNEFEGAHHALRDQGLLPAMALLRQEDQKSVQHRFSKLVVDQFQTIKVIMDKLIKMQLDIGNSDYAQAQANYEKFRRFAILVVLCGLLIATGMTVWLIRSISTPLGAAVRISKAISGGDLTQEITVSSRDETGTLLSSLKEMNTSLQNIVGQVRTGTDTIASAICRISSGNLDLSQRTEQQARSLEKTTTATQQLTSTVKQNSESARQARQLALSASEIAARGGEVVGQVVQIMADIHAQSGKVGNIIAVIDHIAFQTNVLALNAAVEAARANEQGRGFAVVASEVRKLAQSSADAAREIKTLIHDSATKIVEGSVLVNRAGATMDEIVSSIQGVTDITHEISIAGNAQEVDIRQISGALTEMSGVTQKNASLVEQAVAEAALLEEQAAELTDVVGLFKLRQLHASQVAAYEPEDILGESRRNRGLQMDSRDAVDVRAKDV